MPATSAPGKLSMSMLPLDDGGVGGGVGCAWLATVGALSVVAVGDEVCGSGAGGVGVAELVPPLAPTAAALASRPARLSLAVSAAD